MGSVRHDGPISYDEGAQGSGGPTPRALPLRSRGTAKRRWTLDDKLRALADSGVVWEKVTKVSHAGGRETFRVELAAGSRALAEEPIIGPRAPRAGLGGSNKP